eukprot:scaffold246708_cov28-Tisochrysis_lutea.AAC.6
MPEQSSAPRCVAVRLLRACARKRACLNVSPVLIPYCDPSHDPGSPNRGLYDGDVLGHLGFKDGEEVLGAAEGRKAVGICELREDADVA